MAGKKRNADMKKRLALGRTRSEASFPVALLRAALPKDYAEVLRRIKERIGRERLRTVLAANAAMVTGVLGDCWTWNGAR